MCIFIIPQCCEGIYANGESATGFIVEEFVLGGSNTEIMTLEKDLLQLIFLFLLAEEICTSNLLRTGPVFVKKGNTKYLKLYTHFALGYLVNQ